MQKFVVSFLKWPKFNLICCKHYPMQAKYRKTRHFKKIFVVCNYSFPLSKKAHNTQKNYSQHQFHYIMNIRTNQTHFYHVNWQVFFLISI